MNEDATLAITGLSVGDADGGTLTVTLTADRGTIGLAGVKGLTFLQGTKTGSSVVSIRGSIADINTAIGTLTYQPFTDYNGAGSVRIDVSDGGTAVTQTIAITINPVNDAPVVSPLNATLTVNEDTPLTFPGFSVSDVDDGSVSVTVAMANGTIAMGSTAGLTFTNGTGNGQALITFTGSPASVNAALNSLTYTPTADYFGSSLLTVTVTDASNASTTTSRTIVVNNLNDAPVLTDANAGIVRTAVEDTSLTISGLTLTDSDDPDTQIVSVTLTATHGSVTLTQIAGLTFVNGTSNGDSVVTVTGTEAAMAAAIASFTVRPEPNYNGTGAQIRVDATDANNATRTLLINNIVVQPVNDAPTLSPTAATVAEGAGNMVTLDAANFGLTDVDLDIGLNSAPQVPQQIIFRVTQLPAAAKGYLVFGDAHARLVVGSTFSLKDVQDGKVRYVHTGYQTTATGGTQDSFAVVVDDGAGGTDSGIVPITITPVNQPPAVSGFTVAQTAYEGRKGVDLTISASDPDQTSDIWTVVIDQIDAKGGTLYIDANDNNVFDAGDTRVTDGYRYTGTLAAMKLSFDVSPDEPAGNPSFRVTLTDDGGGTSPVATRSGSRTVEIAVRENNDDPVLSTFGAGVSNGYVVQTGVPGAYGYGVSTTPAGPVAVNVSQSRDITITNAILGVSDPDSAPGIVVYTLTARPDVALALVQVYRDGAWRSLGVGGSFTQQEVNDNHVRLHVRTTANGAQTAALSFSVRDSEITAFSTTSQTEIPGGREGGTRNAGDTGYLTHTLTFNLAVTGNTGGPGEPDPIDYVVNDPGTVDARSVTTSNASVHEGGTTYFQSTSAATGGYLKATDPDTPADELVFRLTELPTGGLLQIYRGGNPVPANDAQNWVALALYGSFTQKDVDQGKVRFVHDGGEDHVQQFRFSVSDGRNISAMTTVGIEVIPVNDTPTAGVSGTAVLTERNDTSSATQGIYVFNTPGNVAISLGDADGSLDTIALPDYRSSDTELSFTVTRLPQYGKLQLWNGSSWQDLALNGVVTRAQLNAGFFRYVHDGSENFSDSFRIVPNDGKGVAAATAAGDGPSTGAELTIDLAIASLNDDPVFSANTGLRVAEGGQGIIGGSATAGAGNAISGGAATLRYTDPDNTTTQRQYRITDATDNGTLRRNGVALGVGSTFTQADLDAGLITYTHNGSETGTDSFSFVVSDGGGGSEPAGTFQIVIDPLNVKPTVTGPTANILYGTTDPLSFTGSNRIVVGDMDLDSNGDGTPDGITAGESNFLRVTISDGAYTGPAVISILASSGVTVVTGGTTLGNGRIQSTSGEIVLQGTLQQIQAALDSLQYLVQEDADQIIRLTVTVDDRLHDGAGTLAAGTNGGTANRDGSPVNDANNTATHTITLFASNVNDQHGLTIGVANQTASEDTYHVITGFTLTDVESDAFGLNMRVTLSVSQGTIALVNGAGVAVAASNGNRTLTVTGTRAAIETALNRGVRYLGAANFNGGDTLQVALDEFEAAVGDGNVANATKTATFNITVLPVNDQITLAVDGSQVAVDSEMPKKIGMWSTTVGDADLSPASIIQVMVRVLDSTGAPLASYAGVTLDSDATGHGATVDASYTGAGTALVLRGTVSELNAYLYGLRIRLTGDIGNSDASYKLQIIADDRLRDRVTGALVDSDPGTPEVEASANGGSTNQTNVGKPANAPSAIPTTAYDPTTETSAISAIYNVAVVERTLFASTFNNAPSITASPVVATEGSSTIKLDGTNGNISIADTDDNGGTLSVTLSIDHGSITTVGNSGGTVAIAADKRSVTLTGTKDQVNSRLKAITITYPDDPGAATSADWHGTVTVTVVVNDQGNTGARPTAIDTAAGVSYAVGSAYADSTNGALKTTKTITITVNPVNDRPTVTAGQTIEAVTVQEGTSVPAGTAVSDILTRITSYGDGADDVSASGGGNTATGPGYIAIVGNAAVAAQGKWQYSLDGTNWTDVPASLSVTSALVLGPAHQLRFIPAGNFYGTPGALSVRVADLDTTAGTSGITTGAGRNLNNTPDGDADLQTGRWSSNSVLLQARVTNENDRPTAADATLPAIDEETLDPPGATVATLFGSSFADATDDQTGITGGSKADMGSLGGVAIVGNAATAAQGRWEYSVNGGTSWTAIDGSVSETSALLLPTAAKIRFVPVNDDYYGTPGTLTVRLSDTPVSYNAATPLQDISATLASQTSHWSGQAKLSTSVLPANDAPTIAATDSAATVSEASGVGTGTNMVALVGGATVSDPDGTGSDYTGTASMAGGSIVVTITDYRDGDTLSLAGSPTGAGATSSTVSNGVLTFTISLTAAATEANVAAIIDAIRYSSSSDNPTANGTDTQRSYKIVLNDGNNDGLNTVTGRKTSLPSNELTGTIDFAAADSDDNDPPTVDLNGATSGADHEVTWTEGANTANTPVRIAASDAALGDPDNGNAVGMVLSVTGIRDGNDEMLTIGGTDFRLATTTTATVTVNGQSFQVAVVPTVDGAGDGSTVLTITPASGATRSIAGFQALLRGITYTIATANDDPTAGDRRISVQITDAGDDDAGGAHRLPSNQPATVIHVVPVNDQPVLSGLDALTVLENTANAGPVLIDSDINLTDGDSRDFDGGSLTVGGLAADDVVSLASDPGTAAGQLRLSSGKVDLFDGTGWVQIGTTDTTQAGKFIIRFGSPLVDIAVVEHLIEHLTYRNTSDTPTATRTLTLLADDGDGGTPISGSVTVTVTAENEAPRVSASNVDAAEGNASIVLNGTNANITVNDPDVGNGVMTVTVSVDQSASITGVENLTSDGTTTGGAQVTNLNGGSITLTGTQAQINTALNALTVSYPTVSGAAASDWNGTITVTLVVNDRGNSGARPSTLGGYVSGGAEPGSAYVDATQADGNPANDTWLQTTRSFTITVAPRNDTPVITAPDTSTTPLTVDEDTVLSFTGGNQILFGDAADLATGAADSFTVTLTATNGRVTVSDPGNAVTGEGTGTTLTLTGTRVALNAALATLTFTPTADYPTASSNTASVRIDVNDGGNGGTGSGAATATASRTVGITVSRVSDTPDLTIDANRNGTADAGETNPGSPVAMSGAEGSWILLPIRVAETDTDFSETLSLAVAGLPAGTRYVVNGATAPTGTGTELLAGATTITVGDATLGTGGSTVNLWVKLPPNWNTQGGGASGITAGFIPLTVTATSQDGGATAVTRTATINLTVASVENDPVPAADTGSVTEDTSLIASGNVLANDTDADAGEGQVLRVTAVEVGTTSRTVDTASDAATSIGGAYGTLVIRRDGTYSYALSNSLPAVQGLRAGQTLTETFTYTVDDFLPAGGNAAGAARTATLTITINGTDDAPVVDLDSTTAADPVTVTYREAAGTDTTTGMALFPDATLVDADSANLSRMVVTVAGVRNGDDEILRIGGTDFALGTVAGTPVTVGGFAVTVAVAGTTSTLTITRAGGVATVGSYETLLKGITYRNLNDTPDSGARSVTVQVTDAGSNDDTSAVHELPSNSAVANLTLLVTNDPPRVDLNGAAAGDDYAVTWTETANAPHPSVGIADPAAALLSDVDNANAVRMTLTLGGVAADRAAESLTIGGTVFTLNQARTNVMVASGAFRVGYDPATGVFDITPAGATATLAAYQALLRDISYTNASDNPTAGDRTIDIRITDAGTGDTGTAGDTLGNPLDTNRAVTTITVVPVNDQPRFAGAYQAVTMAENAVNVVGGTPAALITNAAAVSLVDADSPSLTGGSVTVTGLIAEDVLSLPLQPAEGEGAVRRGSGDAVQVWSGGAWRTIGTIVRTSADTLTIALTGADAAAYATVGTVERVIEALTYQNGSDRPTPGPRTLTITVGDGTPGGVAGTATVELRVTPENDRPTIGGFGPTGPTFVEDGAAVLLDPDATLFDADIGDASAGPNDYSGVVLTFQRNGGTPNAEDVFGFSGNAGTAGSVYVGTDGKLHLANASADPADDPVIGTLDTGTPGRLVVTLGDGATAVTQALASRVVQSVTYRNTSENVDGISAGPVAIALTVDDNRGATPVDQGAGQRLTASAVTSVAITPVNEPIFTGTTPALAPVTYPENAGAVRLFNDPAVRITDNDNSSFGGGLVTARFTAGGQDGDRLTVTGSGDAGSHFISVSGSSVLWDADGAGSGAALVIGTISGGIDAATSLRIALNGNATPAAVQALIRQIAFRNDSQDPVGGAAALRTVAVDVRNGPDGAATTQSVAGLFTNSLRVVPENDAPVISRPDGSTITGAATPEWTGAGSYTHRGDTVADLIASLGADAGDADNHAGSVGTPRDGLGLAITAVANSSHGVWQYSLDDGATWTDVPASVSATTALLLNPADRIRFVPAAQFNGDPGASLTLKLWDRTSAGTDTTADDPNTTDGDRNTGDNDQFSRTTLLLKASVSPVNDPPVNTVPTVLTGILEDTPFTFSGTNRFNIADPDVDENPVTADRILTVTLTAQNGRLTLGDATLRGRVTFQSGDGVEDAAVTVAGTLADLQALLGSVVYRGNPNFNGTETITIATSDNGNYGAGGVKLDQDTVTFTVQAVNDAPVATSTAAVTLAPVAEDVAGVANLGSTVADLFQSRLSDAADAVAGGSSANTFHGVVIVGGTADPAKGRWQYQIDGTGPWQEVGSRSLATALVLDGNDRLRFQPAADFNGPAPDLALRLVEAGGGAPAGGTVVDLSAAGATGGATPYADSGNQLTLQTGVTPVNDRPTVGGTVAIAVTEDSSPAGASFADLIGTRYGDATDDRSALGGTDGATPLTFVAIVGNGAKPGQGSWQYLAAAGWTDIPATGLGDGSALVLSAATQVRFLPAADFHGTPGALTLRVADGSANPVTASGGPADLKDLSVAGGLGTTDRWSDGTLTLQPSVANVNDAPTATGTAALPAVAEDTPASAITGATVAGLFGALYGDALDDRTGIDGGADASTPALAGIAIVGNAATAAQGQWSYSTDGITWTALPDGLSDGSALVLPVTARLRFVPAADWNGTPGGLTVRLSDAPVSSAAAGQSLTAGGTGNWSAGTVTLGTAVTAVEDAIEAADDVNGIVEDAAAPATGTVLANDRDRDALGTIAPQRLFVTAIQPAGAAAATVVDTAGTGSVTVAGRYGTLTIDRDGTYSYAIDNSLAVIQQLRQGQTLTDEVFTYTVDDFLAADGTNVGSAAVTRSLSIVITGVNDRPVAVADRGDVQEDAIAPATGNVLSNDTEVDADDPSAVTAVRFGGTAGTVGQGLRGSYGTLVLNAAGTWSYAVDNSSAAVQALAAGETLTETFTYTITDTAGGSGSATLTVVITGVNDAPVLAAEDSSGGVKEDVRATGGVLTDSGTIAFTDLDRSDSHTVASRFVSTSGTAQLGSLTSVLTADTTGSGTGGVLTWTYSVDNARVQTLREGETVTETYAVTVSDGKGGTETRQVVITITGTNDAPTVTGPAPQASGLAGLPIALSVERSRFADIDAGDVLTFTATLADGRPLPSWLSFDPATLTFRGTPPAGTNGDVALLLRATDTAGASVTLGATLSITAQVDPAVPVTPPVPPVTPTTPPTTPTTPTPPPGTLITVVDTTTPTGPTSPAGTPTLGPVTGAPSSLTTFVDVVNVVTGTSSASGYGANAVVAATSLNRRADGTGMLSTDALFRQTTSANVDLFLAGSVGNQVMLPQQQTSFQVPPNVFRHTNPGEKLVYQATRPDGSPLPNWLQFDAPNMTFRGTPPASARGNVDVVIIAKDTRGNQAAAQFRILVSQDLRTGTPVDDAQREAGNAAGRAAPPVLPVPPAGGQGAAPAPQGEAPNRTAPPDGGRPQAGAPGATAPAQTPARDQRAEVDVESFFGMPAGRSAFTAQVQAAGLPGLLAEARALLDTLLAASDTDQEAA
ncbi:hypothetical protein DEW08_24430 (plasmid) [Azospirillum thermophilum]|uniref:Dystroglycan-type cadherin-like domain-containing protein n=2 Tax=Azospirillum thermophilum TaxID=2202148 RepID=A0A2S2CX93_9PROT|nr:hypothetical protein DEW08_24430 [Azospirillum thermophilum]